MGVGYAEYKLLRNLAGFELVTICCQDRPKMPRELRRMVRMKNQSDLPLPLLKQE